MKRFVRFFTFVVALMGLVCTTCKFNTEEPSGSSETGWITVSIGIEGRDSSPSEARTVYPDFSSDLFGKYDLSFTPTEGGAAHNPVVVSNGSASVDLVVGTYTLTAKAYTGSEGSWMPVAEKERSGVEVSARDNSPVSLILGPKTGGGTGTFTYDITLNDGITGNLSVTTEDNQAVTNGTITLNTGGNTSSVSLAPGVYRLGVQVANGVKSGGFNETLHIYTGLTSTLTKTYNERDLAETGDPVAVNTFDLTGLFSAPVTGATPVTSFDGDQYMGAIVWKTGGANFSGDAFAASTVYTAKVTLTAEPGYTFEGGGANAFSHGSISGINAAGSGIVIFEFPATGASSQAPDPPGPAFTKAIDLYLAEGLIRDEWTGQDTADEGWVLSVEEQSTVYVAAYKEGSQVITVSGQDAALVSTASAVDGISAGDEFAVFVVSTGDLVFDGGTRTFILNVSEEGSALPRTVTVTLNVNPYETGAAVFKLVERDGDGVEYLERVGGNFDGVVAAFEWVETNAQEDTEYTLRVEKDEINLPRFAVSLNKANNAALRLRGTQGAPKILQHGNTDALVNTNNVYVPNRQGFFQLNSGDFNSPSHITFILGNNITLKGVGQGNPYSKHYDHLITLYDNATLVLEPGSLITEYVGLDSINDQPIFIDGMFVGAGTDPKGYRKSASHVHIKGGAITNCTFLSSVSNAFGRVFPNNLIRFRNVIAGLETDAVYKAAGVTLHLSGNTNNYVGDTLGEWRYDLDTAEEIRVPVTE